MQDVHGVHAVHGMHDVHSVHNVGVRIYDIPSVTASPSMSLALSYPYTYP